MKFQNKNEVRNFLDKTESVFEEISKPEVRQVLDGSSMRYELFVKGKKLCSCDDNDSVTQIESALRAPARLMSLIFTSIAVKSHSADAHGE